MAKNISKLIINKIIHEILQTKQPEGYSSQNFAHIDINYLEKSF